MRVHFVIYGHEWCFESSPNGTSHRRVQFENFQNIMSDHKSRNARAGSYHFLFIIFSTKLLTRATLYALRTTSNASMVSNVLTCFIWTNQKYNVVTGKSSVKFLKGFEKIQKISRKLNFQLRWFPSFALRIPTAHDFCVISARKWAHARTKRKRFPSN